MPQERPVPGKGINGKDGSYTYITDRDSNPFGMRYPCNSVVPGYGDVNADLHVIGAHPGEHGGHQSGVPFTDSAAGKAMQHVLHDAGLLEHEYSSEPSLDNMFWSYLDPCVCEKTTGNTDHDMEPFFDAELRAVGAHVLFPVGAEATRHILTQYSAQAELLEQEDDVYGRELHGNGFLIVPLPDPWDNGQDELASFIKQVVERDYRQVKAPRYTSNEVLHF